jgi:hypothetical protein
MGLATSILYISCKKTGEQLPLERVRDLAKNLNLAAV